MRPAFASVHSEPSNLHGESIIGLPPGSVENSGDIHNQTEENQNDAEEDSKDNENMESVTEGISEHGYIEQIETDENTDAHSVSNVKGDRDEISECMESEEVSEENYVEGEVIKYVLEEHCQQEERDESYSEEHTAEKKVVNGRISDKLTIHNLAEEAAAVQSILLRPEALAVNQELAPGSEFLDYESFVGAVNRYSDVHGVIYVTAFSKTVSARNKECLKPFNERLRFINLRLRCKYGGVPRASVARIRKHKLTYKKECPSTLTVVAQRNPDRLRVTSFVEEHNHEMEPQELRNFRAKQASGVGRLEAKRRSLSIASRYSGSSTTTPETSSELTRALSNNLSPSGQTLSNGDSPRSPMVKIPSLGNMTSPLKFLPPFRLPTPPTKVQGKLMILKRKNALVVSTPKLTQGAKLAMNQNASVEHQYAVPSQGPPFNKEVVIDISEDDDCAESDQSKAVARVNDAWKCVYRLLENDHQRLRAETDQLRKENQRLRANVCAKCGEKRS